MRLTEFWSRMEQAFGAGYVSSVAADLTIPQLNGRTVNQAIADGVETKVVWRAVCAAHPDRVPAKLR